MILTVCEARSRSKRLQRSKIAPGDRRGTPVSLPRIFCRVGIYDASPRPIRSDVQIYRPPQPRCFLLFNFPSHPLAICGAAQPLDRFQTAVFASWRRRATDVKV
jgi:hypothetical protein